MQNTRCAMNIWVGSIYDDDDGIDYAEVDGLGV